MYLQRLRYRKQTLRWYLTANQYVTYFPSVLQASSFQQALLRAGFARNCIEYFLSFTSNYFLLAASTNGGRTNGIFTPIADRSSKHGSMQSGYICFAPCNIGNMYIFRKHENSSTKYAKTSHFYRVVFTLWMLEFGGKLRTLTAHMRELVTQTEHRTWPDEEERCQQPLRYTVSPGSS